MRRRHHRQRLQHRERHLRPHRLRRARRPVEGAVRGTDRVSSVSPSSPPPIARRRPAAPAASCCGSTAATSRSSLANLERETGAPSASPTSCRCPSIDRCSKERLGLRTRDSGTRDEQSTLSDVRVPRRESRRSVAYPSTGPESRAPRIVAMLPTIAWDGDDIVMIDQRRLPGREVYVRCRTGHEVAKAITDMVIRGAPAIGVAAAMGLALGAQRSTRHRHPAVRDRVRAAGRRAGARRGRPRSTCSGRSSG